jgi:hypothetical protein
MLDGKVVRSIRAAEHCRQQRWNSARIESRAAVTDFRERSGGKNLPAGLQIPPGGESR